MYLEKGIEEFRENHKPSPFTIACPYCGGLAMDVSGIQKVPGGGYVPLPDGYSYFAHMENRDCGVPVFCQEAERTRTSAPVPDVDEIIDRLTSVEMEKRRENLRKELDQLEEILKNAGEATAMRWKEFEIAMKRIVKIAGMGAEEIESQPEKLADLKNCYAVCCSFHLFRRIICFLPWIYIIAENFIKKPDISLKCFKRILGCRITFLMNVRNVCRTVKHISAPKRMDLCFISGGGFLRRKI